MKASGSSDTLARIHQITRRHVPEDRNLVKNIALTIRVKIYSMGFILTRTERKKTWSCYSISTGTCSGYMPKLQRGRCWEKYEFKHFIILSYIFFSLWRYSPNLGLSLPPWNFPFHFSLLDLKHSVGLLVWVISSSQGLYHYTNTEKRTYTHKH
jgi:hypothetical protein